MFRQLSARFRARRAVALRQLITEISQANGGRVKILDLGGKDAYWRGIGLDFLRQVGATVVLLNNEPPEVLPDVRQPNWQGLLHWEEGDACAVTAADNAFDLVHSNSVIEHVGGWDRQVEFAREVRRLAPRYYVQTPNFWFPIDPHRPAMPAIHWMPRDVAVWLMMRLALCTSGRVKTREKALSILHHCQMLTERQMRLLFPTGALRRERLAGLTKSWVLVR